jgi:hypothetical protein
MVTIIERKTKKIRPKENQILNSLSQSIIAMLLELGYTQVPILYVVDQPNF